MFCEVSENMNTDIKIITRIMPTKNNIVLFNLFNSIMVIAVKVNEPENMKIIRDELVVPSIVSSPEH
jgi:hypothetical protein